jgi:DNA-binding MarR family transcriptional regulator
VSCATSSGRTPQDAAQRNGKVRHMRRTSDSTALQLRARRVPAARRVAIVMRVTEPDIVDDDLVARWAIIVDGVASTQRQLLKRIEDSGVPAQWFAVLHLLLRVRDHRMPMSLLARDLSMTSGGFTKLADRMASEELIDRRGSSGDRRVVYAALTDRGRQVARRATREYQRALRAQVLDVLSMSDVNTLAELLGALHRAHASDPVEGVDLTSNDVSRRDPAAPDRRSRRRRTRAPADHAAPAGDVPDPA